MAADTSRLINWQCATCCTLNPLERKQCCGCCRLAEKAVPHVVWSIGLLAASTVESNFDPWRTGIDVTSTPKAAAAVIHTAEPPKPKKAVSTGLLGIGRPTLQPAVLPAAKVGTAAGKEGVKVPTKDRKGDAKHTGGNEAVVVVADSSSEFDSEDDDVVSKPNRGRKAPPTVATKTKTPTSVAATTKSTTPAAATAIAATAGVVRPRAPEPPSLPLASASSSSSSTARSAQTDQYGSVGVVNVSQMASKRKRVEAVSLRDSGASEPTPTSVLPGADTGTLAAPELPEYRHCAVLLLAGTLLGVYTKFGKEEGPEGLAQCRDRSTRIAQAIERGLHKLDVEKPMSIIRIDRADMLAFMSNSCKSMYSRHIARITQAIRDVRSGEVCCAAIDGRLDAPSFIRAIFEKLAHISKARAKSSKAARTSVKASTSSSNGASKSSAAASGVDTTSSAARSLPGRACKGPDARVPTKWAEEFTGVSRRGGVTLTGLRSLKASDAAIASWNPADIPAELMLSGLEETAAVLEEEQGGYICPPMALVDSQEPELLFDSDSEADAALEHFMSGFEVLPGMATSSLGSHAHDMFDIDEAFAGAYPAQGEQHYSMTDVLSDLDD